MFRIFTPFALGYLIASVFRSINAVIGHNIAVDVGATATELGLLTSTFFLAAILTQLPTGLALDRFGPRNVGAVLLMVSAAGGTLFAVSDSVLSLAIGRALIGVGVASGMAVAFKAFSQGFQAHQLPLMNGLGLAAGGVGVMFGTWPVEMALGFLDWREIVLIASVLMAAASIFVFLVTPRDQVESSGITLQTQLRGLNSVLTDRRFWQIAPLVLVFNGIYAGILALWAGPWLRDVAGFDRTATAETLFLMTAMTVIAMPLGGYVTARLSKFGISTMNVVLTCAILFCAVLLSLLVHQTGTEVLTWMFFGIVGPTSLLAYAAIGQYFPKQMTGRVNACLTLSWMGGAFLVQTGVGVILDLFPQTTGGGYSPEGYQITFGLLALLQLSAILWYIGARRLNTASAGVAADSAKRMTAG